MTTKARRPITVWIAQAVLLISALLWLFVLAMNLNSIAQNPDESAVAAVMIMVGVFGGISLLLLAAFWGLMKRREYGRWLTVALLSIWWFGMLYLSIWPPNGPMQPYEVSSPGQRLGAGIARLLICALFLILTLRMALAKSVIRFFKDTQAIPELAPPPPPRF